MTAPGAEAEGPADDLVARAGDPAGGLPRQGVHPAPQRLDEQRFRQPREQRRPACMVGRRLGRQIPDCLLEPARAIIVADADRQHRRQPRITAPPSPRVDGHGTHTDFLRPGILIYEPQADGSMQLVAVENLVFARSWRATGRPDPPTFHGVPYDTMADDPATPLDEAHMFEPHFDRHVWIYRDNPNGVFAPFNPVVTCAHHRGAQNHPHAAGGR